MNKTKSQSGFAHLMIITVILGLGFMGTLGFVFYQNVIQKKDDEVKTGDSSKVKEDEAKDVVVFDEKASWKTYTNTIYGYSFKYPSDWSVQEAPTKNGNSFPSPNPDVLAVSPKGDDLRIWTNIQSGWGYEIDNFDMVNYSALATKPGVTLSDRVFNKGKTLEDFQGYQVNIDFDYGNDKYLLMGTGSDKTQLDAAEITIKQIISTWKFS